MLSTLSKAYIAFAVLGGGDKADGPHVVEHAPLPGAARQRALQPRVGHVAGRVRGAGVRAYLAVRGSFDVPEYLGSRATFSRKNLNGCSRAAKSSVSTRKPQAKRATSGTG